jgi:hypothetical protein
MLREETRYGGDFIRLQPQRHAPRLFPLVLDGNRSNAQMEFVLFEVSSSSTNKRDLLSSL